MRTLIMEFTCSIVPKNNITKAVLQYIFGKVRYGRLPGKELKFYNLITMPSIRLKDKQPLSNNKSIKHLVILENI